MIFLLLLLSNCFYLSTARHVCTHDSFVAENQRLGLNETIVDHHGEGRREAEASWDNLRIYLDFAYLSDDTGGKNDLFWFVVTATQKAARLAEDALQVHRLAKLKVEPGSCENLVCEKNSVFPGCRKKVGNYETCIEKNSITGESCPYKARKPGDPTFDYGSHDFVAFVRYKKWAGCHEDAVAWASSCQRDTSGRPTAGYVNICPNQVKSKDDYPNAVTYNSLIKTILHELLHALGFSSSGYDKMVDQDGKKIKKSAIVNQDSYGRWRVITPRVVAHARSFWKCPEIQYVELEDSGGGGTAGSHWEERILPAEVMEPTVNLHLHGARFSRFTLSFLEDSGWFLPDYTKAETYWWGYTTGKKRCGLVQEPCVLKLSGGRVALKEGTPEGTFCDTKGAKSCSWDRVAKGYCAINTFDREKDPKIPAHQQYWSNDPTKYGDSTRDFCPVYETAYVEEDEATSTSWKSKSCKETRNQRDKSKSAWDVEYYGTSSYCFMSSALRGGYIPRDELRPMCFKVSCNGFVFTEGLEKKARVLKIKLLRSDGYVSVTCGGKDHGRELDLSEATNGLIEGKLKCPEVYEMFCDSYQWDLS